MRLKKNNNVYVVGLEEIKGYIDKSNIIREESWDTYEILKNFPREIDVDNIKDLKNKKGFAVLIDAKSIDNIICFDKENRSCFSGFKMVIIVGENINNSNYKFNHYENIGTYDSFDISEFLDDLFVNYYSKEKNIKKFHKAKILVLNKIYNYIKFKNTISSKEISDRFKISLRQVERYMLDINYLYNRIGYDYSKNVYYITK